MLLPFFAIHPQDANHTVALISCTLSRYCFDTSEPFHLVYIRVGERVDERGIERTEYNEDAKRPRGKRCIVAYER